MRHLDEGVWRRMKLVPFTVSIPKERRDQHLEDKLWEERSGILNWLLDGTSPLARVPASRAASHTATAPRWALSTWSPRRNSTRIGLAEGLRSGMAL